MSRPRRLGNPRGVERSEWAVRVQLLVLVAFLVSALGFILVASARPAAESGSQELRPLLGDANCDGFADSLDAALVLQLEAGLDVFLAGFPDANEDGRVTSIDAALILQFDAGLLIDRYAAGCLSTQGAEGLRGAEGVGAVTAFRPPRSATQGSCDTVHPEVFQALQASPQAC